MEMDKKFALTSRGVRWTASGRLEMPLSRFLVFCASARDQVGTLQILIIRHLAL